jgi:hypothetical protein
MSFLDSLKKFFGFGPHDKVAPAPTSVDQFKTRYAATPVAEKQAYLEKTKAEVETESARLLTQVMGQTGNANAFFVSARECFALSCYLYQQTHPASSGVDKDYEALLGRLVRFAEVYAKPTPELLESIDSYIQTYEEVLYLAEASGNYRLSVSEYGVWLRFPFLIEKDLKPGRKSGAEQELKKLFVPCPELSLLEMETRVPWLPISFVEIVARNSQSRMTLLSDPNKQLYYGYRYT